MEEFKIVVIGASLGGLNALEILLPGLPADFPLPVVVAQHRGIDAEDLLSVVLQRLSALPMAGCGTARLVNPQSET